MALRKALDRLLPPAGVRRRVRPEELLYSVEERPPVGLVVSMAAQHAFLALIFAIYSVVAARAIGLDPPATTAFVSASILLLGLNTLLQASRSRFGAGMILVSIPSAGRLPIFVAITLQFGLAATMGATIVNAVLAMVLARFFPRLRPLFPPEVIGVVVLMLGLSLIPAGVTRGAGLTQHGVSGAAMVAALACIGSIVAVSLWAPIALRRLAMVAGALAGTLAALLTGVAGADPGPGLLDMPPLAIPGIGLPILVPTFEVIPVALFAILQVLVTMDLFGCVLSMDKMEDARWRRVDMAQVARAVTANSLVQLLHGLAGLLPNSISSANIGLANATGVTSRRVGAAAGLMLMAAAFLPPLARVISIIPEPVIGGILIYTASYMIVSGMSLIMSRMMNNQRSFTVGLAVVSGVSVMLLPELGRAAPEWSRLLVNSGLAVASIVAIGLNAILRLGVKRSATLVLDPLAEGREAADFLDRSGRAWGALQDVVVRADVGVGEALDALRHAGVAGPVTLSVSFDEFYLHCRLRYAGRPLILDAGPPDLATLLDGSPAEMDAALRRISGAVIRRFADDVRAVQRQDHAELIMRFDA